MVVEGGIDDGAVMFSGGNQRYGVAAKLEVVGILRMEADGIRRRCADRGERESKSEAV